jgi:hypothetical protein
MTGKGAGDTGDAFLPGDLIELIEKGVAPQDDLSAAFHHVVCWLADCGWSAERIERRIAGKPIVPARYAKRLGKEIARCLRKRNQGTSQGPQGEAQGPGGEDLETSTPSCPTTPTSSCQPARDVAPSSVDCVCPKCRSRRRTARWF